jgi:Fic family protein
MPTACARESAVAASEQIRELARLRRAWRERFQDPKHPAALVRLIDHLFVSPTLTLGEVAARLKVSNATAGRYVAALVEAGILSERTGRKRGQVFVARPLVRLVDARPAAPGGES